MYWWYPPWYLPYIWFMPRYPPAYGTYQINPSFPPQPFLNPSDELNFLIQYREQLRAQIRELEEELRGVEARIEELRRMTGFQ